jgi:molybdate transport system regulatory protein
MNVSARNVFEGKITALVVGAVNAEVELTLPSGDRIVTVVTMGSVKSLGLAVGKEAVAYVKAPWVVLLSGQPTLRFSARNQLSGKVVRLEKGGVNSEVGIELSGGTVVHAIVTNDAVEEMGLGIGVPAMALFKASHVILGVSA